MRISILIVFITIGCTSKVSEATAPDSLSNAVVDELRATDSAISAQLKRDMEPQRNFLASTDSSTIKTVLYSGGKEVTETVNNKNLVYYTFYENNLGVATSTATLDKSGRRIGIAREFDLNGKLLYTIDHDKGIWTPENISSYPFYDLQSKVKDRADSVLVAMYGKYFLDNHTIWAVERSAVYNEEESGNWTDVLSQKPERFLFRYHVKLDSRHIYDDLIEFELDATGTFIPNDIEEVFGFEKINKSRHRGFQLSYNKAIQMAKEHGLKETDSTKASAYLTWERLNRGTLYSGQFRFYVTIATNALEDFNLNGANEMEVKDVYSFDPWTGKFVEKTKIQIITIAHDTNASL